MADINRVVLVGRLVRDAELKYTSGGLAITTFGIAINRRRKQGDDWVDEANFFDVVLMGRQGEAVQRYLTKGKQVGVEGELRQNRWEQDGQKRSKVEIFATNVQLLGSRDGGDSGGSRGYSRDTYSEPPQGSGPKTGGEPFAGGPVDDFEDDVPF